jgi:hypothetical protein
MVTGHKLTPITELYLLEMVADNLGSEVKENAGKVCAECAEHAMSRPQLSHAAGTAS